MTLDSVLGQTLPADEILVLNDGSTDETPAILESYKPRIEVVHQQNSGVACARNALYHRSSADLLAFLDSDDLWHPRYLQCQHELFRSYPSAVAIFTGHLDFRGYGSFEWDGEPNQPNVKLLDPITFLRQYNNATGPFASMSYCCIPRAVLERLGEEPFHPALSSVEDSYLCTQLPLLGSVVYNSAPLVAYRQTGESISVNRVKTFGLWVQVFEILKDRYRGVTDLRDAFQLASALKRRCYGKVLMGAGKSHDARRQFWIAATESFDAVSFAKSLSLLLLTYMPGALQPTWPPSYRQ
jgi:glycosyltransferase involved in cell wall biosynthesis